MNAINPVENSSLNRRESFLRDHAGGSDHPVRNGSNGNASGSAGPLERPDSPVGRLLVLQHGRRALGPRNGPAGRPTELGCPSVEIVPPEDWGVLRKHKLICAIAPNGMPGPRSCAASTTRAITRRSSPHPKTIDACADAGFPNVIAFTGYKWRDADDPKSGEISRSDGADNCVKGFREIVGSCGETRRDHLHGTPQHPRHLASDEGPSRLPGGRSRLVAGIIRRVDSPRLKLLFDIYHVQIMHGDIIRRIEQNRDIIGHVHTAGNPGRGELDDRQEIQYAPIMRKLLEIKYTGYVGQEFIPTRNPMEGLRKRCGCATSERGSKAITAS